MTESERKELIKNFTNNITVDKNMPKYPLGPEMRRMLEEAREFLRKHPIPRREKKKKK